MVVSVGKGGGGFTRWEVAGICCPQVFFSGNVPDSHTRGEESPWRIKLTSCYGHDLGAVIFRLLSNIPR